MTAIVPIADIGVVKAAAWKDFDSLSDDVISQCLLSATADIESRIAPRRIVSASYTLQAYDGSSAVGRYRHWLYLEQYPVTTLTLVKENGVTLASGTGYDAAGTKDVLLYGAEGVLARKAGAAGQFYVGSPSGRIELPWAPGLQNLEVTYTAGYLDPVNECPDLVQACIQLAVLHFKTPKRAGQSSANHPTASVSYVADLPGPLVRAIDRYAPYGRPRCRLAA